MNHTTRAAVLALLVALSALTGATAIAGADATPTTHEVRDHQLSTTGNASATWMSTGAALAAADTDAQRGDEARVTVEADAVGLSTLGDLQTLSWSVSDGVGYAPHADVYLDTDGDGTADDALVFEYYKVGTPCDGGTPPTNAYDTFGDKGIVDANATAWLASGAPGPCGDSAFVNGTLSAWQAGSVHANVSAGTAVTHVEIEVDNWVDDPSSATVSAITVNGETYHGQVNHGIAAASAGDTVAVGAGTYDELLRPTVDGLSLVAPDGATIEPSPDTVAAAGRERVVDLGSAGTAGDGLTFEGFTVIGPGNASGWVGVTVAAPNTTVRDTHVSGVLTGLQTSSSGADGATLEANTVTDAQVGISVQSADATVTGNDLSVIASPWEGIGIRGDRAGVSLSANAVDAPAGVPHVRYYVTSPSVETVREVFAANPDVETVGDAPAGFVYLRPEVETVTNVVHEHHHHASSGGGGGTQVVERTVTVQAPSPTPRVETVVVERTVEVPGPERTVVVEGPERTVIREVTQTPGQPGFGVTVAIAALLGAALLALRRRRA